MVVLGLFSTNLSPFHVLDVLVNGEQEWHETARLGEAW